MIDDTKMVSPRGPAGDAGRHDFKDGNGDGHHNGGKGSCVRTTKGTRLAAAIQSKVCATHIQKMNGRMAGR